MRLRLVSVQIVPTFVIEDDEGNLSPGQTVQPVAIPAAQLDQIPTLVRDGMAQMQAQADAQLTA